MKRKRNRAAIELVLTASYEAAGGGWIAAEIVGGKGLVTQGRTLPEARANLLSLVKVMAREAPDQFPSGPRRPPARARFVERVVLVVA